ESTPACSQRPACSRPQSYKIKDEGNGQTPPLLVNSSCQDQQLPRQPSSEAPSPPERKRNGKSPAFRGPWTLNANALAPEAHTQSTYHGDEDSLRRVQPFWEHGDMEKMTGLRAVQSLSPKSFTNLTPFGDDPSQQQGFCLEYRRRLLLQQRYLANKGTHSCMRKAGKSRSGCSRRISPNVLIPATAMNARPHTDGEELAAALHASSLPNMPNFRIFEQLPVYPAGEKDIAVVAMPCRNPRAKKPADREASKQWYKRSYKNLRDNEPVFRLAQ
ncbi:hypothetical protein CYMTET_24266, partial [Cymbomonas tetramitiformis]